MKVNHGSSRPKRVLTVKIALSYILKQDITEMGTVEVLWHIAVYSCVNLQDNCKDRKRSSLSSKIPDMP